MSANRYNLKLTISYEGTDFFGWQKTAEGRSVEEELEKALSIIFQERPTLQATSRTDRGVHARCQVVNVLVQEVPETLHIRLNQLLPGDIALLACETVDEEFHPTLDAKLKEYRYYFTTAFYQFPQSRRFEWFYPHKLDFEKVRQACALFQGRHNFEAFTTSAYSDCIRTIQSVELIDLGEGQGEVRIRGERFMHNMVRIIVGTLMHVGRGKITLEELQTLLAEGGNRKRAGETAPAHGLTLYEIHFKMKE